MDSSISQLVPADLLLEFCVSLPRISGEKTADIQANHGADVDRATVGNPVCHQLVHRDRDRAANLQHISTRGLPLLDRLAPDWRWFARLFLEDDK